MAPGKRAPKIVLSIFLLFLSLFLVIVYLRYRDLKKTFIERLSVKVTSVIGQTVHIEDLSISLRGAINLYDIVIKNPEGFASGQLLRIKRLHLDVRPRELIKGNYSFRNIIIYSPELTLMRGGKDRWNISDGLKRFLSEGSSTVYQVDEFRIDSGAFDVNKDERYHSDAINLRLKNLSSDPNTKTEIRGTMMYAVNEIQMSGWAYLNDKAKKASLSISSKDFALSSYRKALESYKIDTEKTRMNINLQIDGDTEKGLHLMSNLQVKRIGAFQLEKGIEDIRLHADAMFVPRDDSLIVHAASLDANNFSALSLRGVLKDLSKNPSYRGEMKIDRLDLSRLNFMKDIKVRGILSSNRLSIRGRFGSTLPEISGSFRLRGGGMESYDTLIEKIEADASLSFGKEMSIKGEGLARVVKAGPYALSMPVEVKVSTTLHRTQQGTEFLSHLKLSTLETKFKDGRTFSLNSANVMIEGTIKDHGFSGHNLFEIKGIRLADHSIPWLKTSSEMKYQKGEVILGNLLMETEDSRSSANYVRINMPQTQTGSNVEIRGLNAVYRAKEALFTEGDFLINLPPSKEAVSCDLRFSLKNILLKGMSFNHISGSARFDDTNFFVDIADAETIGGRIKITAQGGVSENLFPIKTTFLAEGMDMSALFNVVSKSIEFPYHVAGEMKRANFEGTIHSQESLNGHASLEIKKVSLSKPSTGQNFVKDVFLHADIDFMEKDLTFKAEAATGNLSPRLSGFVKGFMGKERHLQVKGTLADVRMSDIRNTFWDFFPDSLLYVGLQGSISSNVSVDYGKEYLDITANLLLKDFILEGENGEYTVGPINGTIPMRYGKNQNEKEGMSLPSFEKSQFDQMSRDYAQETIKEGFHRLTIGSLRYGFPLLENINLFFKQEGNIWNIDRFSANISGGKLNGSAIIDLSKGFDYRVGLLVKGVSLKSFCDGIEPIKGFISGKVNGVASFKASGIGLSHLIGMADFWTYSAENEKTMISKEFLQKIGGPSLKTYLKNRYFDKGILSLYLKDGYFIFRDLEISNKNFLGITDLSVKVAPVSNRIALDHLLWTIAEAAERAKKKN